MKEQITICIDSQAAVAALATSGTESLLVSGLYRKADSSVRGKPGNHNADTWAERNSAE